MDCAWESSSLLNLFTLIKMLGTYYLWNQHLEARLGIGIGINELLKIVFYKNCKKLSREIYKDRIRLGLNRGVGVLLSTTSFILDEVLILEIMIEDYSINHHLHRLRRSLLKYFSNTTRVQYLPPN